jgi:LCP family protein required for cell wall assembly
MSAHDMGARPASGRAAVPGPSHSDARISGRASVPVSPPPGAGGYGYGGSGGPPGGYGGSGGPPGGYDDHPPALTAGPRRGRRAKVIILSVVLVVALLVGGGLLYLRGLDNNMDRDDFFAGVGDRPPPAAAGSLNILLLGSDSRDPDGSDGPYRADTIMVMHIPSSHDQAYLISIPRDLWIYVPPNADGTRGGHEAKVNASTAWGGVPLMVQTIEGYTGVRLDHVMLIDFGGFVEVTDALGGVEMDIEQTITSIHSPNRTFEQGRQHLDGEEALDYIRQRYQFADGDFTRMRNQQRFLRALMDKATDTGTLANPAKLNAFLQTATSTLTVDEDFALATTAHKFRHLRSHNLTFLTSPHGGTGWAGGQSVVFSDDEGAARLYQAVREDRIAQWVADNPDLVRDG